MPSSSRISATFCAAVDRQVAGHGQGVEERELVLRDGELSRAGDLAQDGEFHVGELDDDVGSCTIPFSRIVFSIFLASSFRVSPSQSISPMIGSWILPSLSTVRIWRFPFEELE